MWSISFSLVIAFSCILSFGQFDFAKASERSFELKVQDVKIKGKDCTNEYNSTLISEDGQVFSVLFTGFKVANRDAGTRVMKKCRLRYEILAPAQWSFGIVSAEFRGFSIVRGDAYARHRATYEIFDKGSREDSEREELFNVRIDEGVGNYARFHDIPLDEVTWSSCNSVSKILMIQSSISARVQDFGEASISVNSIDGFIANSFGLVWKPCL
ncbi:DUF4360 domain-containing protein [Pseudobacteriovorax antillogorgiicola]|uniref:DUF4360 domain-containing protein n=1 Tax=Pseudobacteriovorax antillogorgiicola TaxID=1513793 RepID=A0A1Y6CEJ3_9BACT|nr:DUF4360 domain-containing protein [Pseudobacteriovorax antillogorgiicola]TCS48242.1 uncharacterized protein DUF4360 [Pseudobacteriovorax antillogorgiicola]SMF57285.1 protein of unknown function [Pseudobacteriovorax antillogorgiicola]